MNILSISQGYRYEQDDWRLDITQGPNGATFEIVSVATGGMKFDSGSNLDRLVALIVDAKADALSKNVNWSGN